MTEEDPELVAIRKRKLEELERHAAGAGAKPVAVTDSSFEAFVGQGGSVVIDCWAPWCGPCRAMGPIIDELATRWAGRVRFGKLNTDENPRVAQRFGVMSIPTLLLFEDGQFVDQIVGLPPKQQLVQMLAPLAG